MCVFTRKQRRRDSVGVGVGNNFPPLDEAELAREGFTRYGEVKGLILDENGLDVLNSKPEPEPVIEIALLRLSSSTSQSIIHNENQWNATTHTDSFEFVNSDSSSPPISVKQSESAPPLPIPVNQSAPALPPPIPVKKSESALPLAKNGPSPSPPPLKMTATLFSSASRPPQAPREPSAEEGLKPLQCDKVNTDSNQSMVWNKVNRSSISFDNDLMEALFGYVAVKKKPLKHGGDELDTTQIFILDPRKSQNIAMELKSLEITHEKLAESLMEVNDFLPERLERLMKLAPTKEEQSAILQFDGDVTKLAATESFLFHLLKAVPFAFTRLKVLHFRANYYPEISQHTKSLQTLNSACTELRSRGLLVKLLEAIIKSGNKLSTGEVFNLTAVLKLSGVKSLDGETTLLNYVVEEVVRSEAKRCRSNSISEEESLRLGLQVIVGLSNKFINVKKSAEITYETLSAASLALTSKAKDMRRDLEEDGGERFVKKMMEFLDFVEEEVKLVNEEEKKVMEIVKRTAECYGGGDVKETDPFYLFVIVRDFLDLVDEVCVETERRLERRMIESFEKRNPVKFPVLSPNFFSDCLKK